MGADSRGPAHISITVAVVLEAVPKHWTSELAYLHEQDWVD